MRIVAWLWTGALTVGCNATMSVTGPDAAPPSSGPPGSGPASALGPPPGSGGAGWPEGNAYSWDGSWTPSASDFPIEGLLDDEYHDGHPGADGSPTPILPPGQWDWDDPSDDLANWRNFRDNVGRFERLEDGDGHLYGWRLVGDDPASVEYTGAAGYVEGSSGADVLDLGPAGSIHSFGAGDLADGPDVLVFDRAWSLHFRTGSSMAGAARDDDLVIAGCGENPDGAWDITTTTIHTGPGHDWVFVRDLSRAGIDLGNGDGGRTDTLDPLDGDDLVVLRGNTQDFRASGGRGNDTFVWYVDDNVQTTTWLAANFFGAGGAGEALWGDPGTDRLVLAVPAATEVVDTPPTPPGAVLVTGTDGELVLDEPTQDDPFARYCVECGEGPGGRRTVIFEYRSADEEVFTGYCYLTAFEELQIGVGEGARVYRLDDVAGRAVAADDLAAFEPPVPPPDFCAR